MLLLIFICYFVSKRLQNLQKSRFKKIMYWTKKKPSTLVQSIAVLHNKLEYRKRLGFEIDIGAYCI